MANNIRGMGVVVMFMLILIGIILMSVTADQVSTVTSPDTTGNDTIALTYGGQSVVLDHDDILTNSDTVYNSTGGTLTRGTNYTINYTAGNITIYNHSDTTYYAAYTYYQDDYIKENQPRNLVGLISIFFALGVLIIGVGYLYRQYGEFFR